MIIDKRVFVHSASQWTLINPILLLSEVGYETDTELYKFGNGTTRWKDLPYAINGYIPGSGGTLRIYSPDGGTTIQFQKKVNGEWVNYSFAITDLYIEQAPGLTRKYKWYQTTETWVSIYYSDDGGETWQDSGQG